MNLSLPLTVPYNSFDVVTKVVVVGPGEWGGGGGV